MRRAVLFDLDGTLLDSLKLILVSYRHTLAAHDLPARSDEEVLAGLGTPLETSLGRWAAAPEDVPALVKTYIDHNLEVHDSLVSGYPGVGPLVIALAEEQRPLAVVTSKRRRGTAMGLEALDLARFFSVRVSADDVERAKPHPEPVEQALRRLRVDANDAVFVGDAIHDVESGRAAGVATIGVTWGAGLRADLEAAGPDAIVDSADALREVLSVRGTRARTEA